MSHLSGLIWQGSGGVPWCSMRIYYKGLASGQNMFRNGILVMICVLMYLDIAPPNPFVIDMPYLRIKQWNGMIRIKSGRFTVSGAEFQWMFALEHWNSSGGVLCRKPPYLVGNHWQDIYFYGCFSQVDLTLKHPQNAIVELHFQKCYLLPVCLHVPKMSSWTSW